MMRLKSQDHPLQRTESAEDSKYCQSFRYTPWKARRVRFYHFFHESWRIKTCTGSKEVQQV